MIKCDMCAQFGHLACYGFLDSSYFEQDRFVCFFCGLKLAQVPALGHILPCSSVNTFRNFARGDGTVFAAKYVGIHNTGAPPFYFRGSTKIRVKKIKPHPKLGKNHIFFSAECLLEKLLFLVSDKENCFPKFEINVSYPRWC